MKEKTFILCIFILHLLMFALSISIFLDYNCKRAISLMVVHLFFAFTTLFCLFSKRQETGLEIPKED
ncbi:MAG: hypothetical protein WCR33_01140 [Bacilli bacterium]